MQLLLTVSKLFGDDYVTNIMLPVFLIAVGDKADLTFIPNRIHTRIKGFECSDFWIGNILVMHVMLLNISTLANCRFKT